MSHESPSLRDQSHPITTSSLEAACRRTLDITASSTALVLLSPVLAAIALSVKMTSPGPILFRQERVGRFGRPFVMLKFRSMHVACPTAEAGPQVTAGGDPRITALGRHIRHWKLDELPQLINVVKGEMSLVGPRPEVRRYARHWSQEQRRTILSVRPGITDPVTIWLRDEEALLATQPDPQRYYIDVLLPRKARRYVTYLQQRSLARDIATIGETFVAVLRR